MTNEQSIVEIEAKVTELKKAYIAFLTPISLKVQSSSTSPHLHELLRCQALGNEYFNYIENFVGNSGLLGAHENGKWITGFAETCQSVLNAYIIHISFLRRYKSVFNGVNIEPDEHSYANMQRMVKLYLPKNVSDELENKFTLNNLPISGFERSGVPDMRKIPTWQLVTALITGMILFIIILLLSVFIPNPTEWQSFVFRGGFAISLAAIAAIVPGFINIDSRIQQISISAGGAIAIFVLVWFVNPPSLLQSNKAQQQMAKS